MKQQSLIVSCVVDSKYKYYEQCIIFINSLLTTGSITSNEIAVHVFEDVSLNFVELLKNLGITVKKTKRFDDTGSVYCNKLMQLKSKFLMQHGHIVLMDTDIVVVENVRTLFLSLNNAAKIVDTPSPPLMIFRELCRRASLRNPPSEATSSFCDGITVHGNCNGGLYIFSKEKLKAIAPLWLKWSYWCLSNRSLLGKYIIHADQIGFFFALLESGLRLEPLSLDMNYPSHLKRESYLPQHNVSPKIIHYHFNIDAGGALKPVGLELVDRSIDLANEQLILLQRSPLWKDFKNTVQHN